jgi:hypothetical protein
VTFEVAGVASKAKVRNHFTSELPRQIGESMSWSEVLDGGTFFSIEYYQGAQLAFLGSVSLPWRQSRAVSDLLRAGGFGNKSDAPGVL